MKTSILLYFIGLIFIAASLFLIVNNPDSGRSEMIAGGLALFGFPLNIAGFMMKQKQAASN